MILAVNPNRMELLRLKKRRELAIRGHKLLKDKQDELMRRFLALINECDRLRRIIDQKLGEVILYFLSAKTFMGTNFLEEAITASQGSLDISITDTRVMNMKIPKVDIRNIPLPSYGLISTSGELDIAFLNFKELLSNLIKLSELEATIWSLSIEIEKTRRRVNALEYVLIPNIEETIGFINMKLGEFERSSITRLMRVKEIVYGR